MEKRNPSLSCSLLSHINVIELLSCTEQWRAVGLVEDCNIFGAVMLKNEAERHQQLWWNGLRTGWVEAWLLHYKLHQRHHHKQLGWWSLQSCIAFMNENIAGVCKPSRQFTSSCQLCFLIDSSSFQLPAKSFHLPTRCLHLWRNYVGLPPFILLDVQKQCRSIYRTVWFVEWIAFSMTLICQTWTFF